MDGFRQVIISDRLPVEGCAITYHDQQVDMTIHSDINLSVVIKENTTLHLWVETHRKVQLYLDIEESVTEFHYVLHLGEASDVRQLVLHDSEDLFLTEAYHLQQYAVLNCGFGEMGNGKIMHHSNYYMDGGGSQLEARYVYMNQGKADKTNLIKVVHEVGHTTANVENYGVASGNSRLHIDVDSHIKKGSSQSITHQTSRILTFEEGVYALVNPMLHIDENDVQASHACSMGVIDELHLYYLQSRGLTKQQAVQLIVSGYISPLSEIVVSDELKTIVSHRILKKAGEYVGY